MVFGLSKRVLALTLLFSVLLAYVPMQSVFEFVETGGIDLDRRSDSISGQPAWMVYLAGWIVFSYFLFLQTIPVMRYFFCGYVLKIGKNEITSLNKTISLDDVAEIRKSFLFNRYSVETVDGDIYYLHLNFAPGSSKAIQDHFPERF
jgi:hypothetical protein